MLHSLLHNQVIGLELCCSNISLFGNHGGVHWVRNKLVPEFQYGLVFPAFWFNRILWGRLMKTRGTGRAAGISFLRASVLCLAFGLALLCLSACGQEKPQGQAAKLAADLDRYIKLFAPKIAPLMEDFDKHKMNQALEKLYEQEAKAGTPVTLSLALLDKSGTYLTGRYPMEGKPGGVEDAPSGKQNYAGYKAVGTCLEKQQVTQMVVYFENEKFYAVCVPLTDGDDTLGVMVLAFGDPFLSGYPGVTQKQVLALELDAPKT